MKTGKKFLFCDRSAIRVFLTLFFLFSASESAAESGECRDTDDFHRNHHPLKIITEDADIFIGALLNVHEEGSSGFFGCGNITAEGVIAYEALNWISSTINQEHGMINGKPVVESFIPGVKIGRESFYVDHSVFIIPYLLLTTL